MVCGIRLIPRKGLKTNVLRVIALLLIGDMLHKSLLFQVSQFKTHWFIALGICLTYNTTKKRAEKATPVMVCRFLTRRLLKPKRPEGLLDRLPDFEAVLLSL